MRGGATRNKPNVLRVLNGNAGKRPLKAQPYAAVRQPDPLEGLTPAERAYWTYYATRLEAARVLTELDRAALANFCRALVQIDELRAYQLRPDYQRFLINRAMDAAGNEKVTETISPSDAALMKWLDKARLLASELGLSPMSRARVAPVAGDDQAHDPAEAFLRAAGK